MWFHFRNSEHFHGGWRTAYDRDLFSIVTYLKPDGKLGPSVSIHVKTEYFYMHFDFLKGYTHKMKTTIAFFFFNTKTQQNLQPCFFKKNFYSPFM